MKKYKSVLCAAPFSSILFSNTTAKPCCHITYDQKNEIEIENDKSILEHFNKASEYLRQDFIKGTIHQNCFNCRLDLSHSEHHSNYTNENINHLENPSLSYLHIDFSNVCNLACRICSHKNSNLLHREMELLGTFTGNGPPIKTMIDRNSKLYASILDNLDKLRYIRFSGGEPLLHEEMWTLLETICKKGYNKDITFKVNTNGTVKLNQRRCDLLKLFKKVDIDVSIDGTASLAEYIRTNVVWDRWIENFKEYQNEFLNLPSHYLNIVCTLSAFNIHKYDTVYEYFTNAGVKVTANMLFAPNELCTYNINQRAKNYLNELYKDKYPKILKFVNLENKIDTLEIVKYIDKKDDTVINNNLYKNYRAFRDVDPEWYAMLKG